MGRLTADPEVRYTQGSTPVAIARYTLAVNRRYKRQGEQEADFISCVAFGKGGEFAEKYLKKGMQISVVGRLQVSSYEKDGKRVYKTDVIVDEQYFAEGKKDAQTGAQTAKTGNNVFYPVDDSVDDDSLPF